MGSDPEDSIVSIHVEATLVTKTGGWSKVNRPEQDSFELEQLRTQCPDPVDIDLMYSFGRKSGLPLQTRFRTVRHVQKGDKESFARLAMEKDGTHAGFWLGPSLIDGSFQASMALADAATGIGTLKIPLSIRRLQPCGRKFSIAVWSYFQLIDFTDKSTVFRSWLLNDAGEALLYFDHVHLQEVRASLRGFLCARIDLGSACEEEDDEREPLRGGVPISEEEWRNLDWFIGQSMIRPLRCAELIYLIAVPSIATVGGFFTTQKTGFPVIFYFMYLPLLLGSKILEVYILKGWGDIDCNAASIQRAQWAKIGFRHPVMLLIFGSLEHADLFLDVVFTATAFSSGFAAQLPFSLCLEDA
ncbi:unnamed protein product [Effrenium voratum]|uniref:PKS/mFAS DH domain-containing protein n=1 Tax=Effrenium voratum TaxID=2562239 RepID=A0AA36IYU6_9DINO|nr:unnamed protein product [Effrenium voratum]